MTTHLSIPGLNVEAAKAFGTAFKQPSEDAARLHRSEVVEYATTLYATLRLNERSIAECAVEALKTALEALTSLAILVETAGQHFSPEMNLMTYGVTEQILHETGVKPDAIEKEKRRLLRAQLRITAHFILDRLEPHGKLKTVEDYDKLLRSLLQNLKDGWATNEVIAKVEDKLKNC